MNKDLITQRKAGTSPRRVRPTHRHLRHHNQERPSRMTPAELHHSSFLLPPSPIDVFHFATALEQFGLCDLAFMGTQAKRRLEFLDSLDRLATTAATTEKQMHTALQNNLWVFGPEYSLMASNRQLRTIIEDYIGPAATDLPFEV